MSYINKQKFLAELGRLLTFMYEEDRQTALAMYTRMFDNAEDEQSLLQFLVSPTRQAVVLARSYDAKERKLQVHSQSRDTDTDDYSGSIPDFVQAIDELQNEALSQGVVATPVDANQFSLFEDGGVDAPAAYETVPQVERGYDAPVYAEQSYYRETVPAPQTPAYEQAPAYQPAPPQAPVYEQAPAYQPAPPQAPVQEEPAPAAAAPAAKATPSRKRGIPDLQPTNPVEQFADAVDAFLADFSINEDLSPEEDDEADAEPQETREVEPAPVPAVREAAPVSKAAQLSPAVGDIRVSMSARQPKTGLLILFIILAVPVTLLGVAILLIPTLLFLALAVGVVSLGVLVFSSAFSGFAVFADILVVLGAALAILALGLLCSWLFVWFIGGAITGLIRGVFHLGSKWCYKEVAAE